MQDGTGCLRENVARSVGTAGGERGAVLWGHLPSPASWNLLGKAAVLVSTSPAGVRKSSCWFQVKVSHSPCTWATGVAMELSNPGPRWPYPAPHLPLAHLVDMAGVQGNVGFRVRHPQGDLGSRPAQQEEDGGGLGDAEALGAAPGKAYILPIGQDSSWNRGL